MKKGRGFLDADVIVHHSSAQVVTTGPVGPWFTPEFCLLPFIFWHF